MRIQESAPPVRVENELPFEPQPTTSEDLLRGPPRDRHLRVRLLGENEPRATKWYVLKLDDGSQREGRTSSHGLLIEKLPASVRRVRLQVGSSDLGFDEHVIDLDVLEQKAQLALTTEGLGHSPITCEARVVDGRLTPYEAVHLVNMALNPTIDVNCHFQEESLFWSMEHLPFAGGTYAIYLASLPTQRALSRFTDQYGLCRRLRDDANAAELREVEEKSPKWLDERTAALKELEKKLADARTAFEADRIPLGILAWALGILQIVGWGLTLIFLPRDVRTLREMRAPRKTSPPPQS